jgi:plastocyanin
MKSRWGNALVVTFLLGAGLLALSCKGKSNPAGPGGADVTIDIVAEAGANSYSPSPDTVSVGQTVAWHNVAGATHTSTADNISIWSTGSILNGSTSAAIQMNTPGTFGYHCTIHPTMTGILVVQ